MGTVIDYAESLFQSIDKIIDKRLSDLRFDETKICTIVNDLDKKNGRYIVSDGSMKFEAYSEIDTYRVDDQVRVSIPNGDSTQKKYIEGKCAKDENNQPATYMSLSDTVLDISDNLASGTTDTFGLKANAKDKKNNYSYIPDSEVCIWSKQFSEDDFYNNEICDTVFIKADFKTLLSDYKMQSGNFGLRLDLYEKSQNGTEILSSSLILDSDDMFGNPYSFSIFSEQSAVGHFGLTNRLSTASLYLYQRNNFVYIDQNGQEKRIQVLFEDEPTIHNIIVKNIYVGIGSNLEKVEDNTLKLYTTDTTIYNADSTDSNEKNISLLWYNKDDNAKYIGFSDGLVWKEKPEGEYELDYYDEIEYLEIKNKDARLLAQQSPSIPNVKLALELAANINEAEDDIQNIVNEISKNLTSILRKLQNKLPDAFSADIDNERNQLGGIATSIQDSFKKLQAYYKYMLDLSNGNEEASDPEYEGDERANIENSISGLRGKIESLLNGISQELEEGANAFIPYVEEHKAQLNQVLDKIDYYKGDFLAKTENYNSTESEDKNSLPYLVEEIDTLKKTPYIQSDLSKYDNRYCIYWYRYDPGYYDADEPFMDRDWHRMRAAASPEEKKGQFTTDTPNYGLPSVSDAAEYYPIKSDEGVLNVELNSNLADERFKAIIFYNHDQSTSNELVFENANPPGDEIALQKNALYIEHGKDSRDSYQIYGVDNRAQDPIDLHRNRELLARYNQEIGSEDNLAGAYIYWYLPTAATLLIEGDNSAQEFKIIDSNNADKYSKYYKEGYKCFYKQIGKNEDGTLKSDDRKFYYKITEPYVHTFTNNTIMCMVEPEQKGENKQTLEAEMYLAFNSYGTSGTDYTLAITPVGNSSALSATGSLDLNITLYDYNGEIIKLHHPNSSGDPYPRLQSVEWVGGKALSGEGSPDIIDEGYDYLKIHIGTPIDRTKYYKVLKAEAAITVDSNDTTKNILLTTYYPISYTSGNWYYQGPSTVIYDSNGSSNPSFYKGWLKLFDSETLKEETAFWLAWKIDYYNENGELWKTEEMPELFESYAPKLKYEEENYYSLSPSVLYLEGVNLYPVITAYKWYPVGSEQVYWAQPIFLMQNRYPSAMLNSWDGSFKIDEENGTIMSTMVGAGKKTANNTFSGVLMGDVNMGAGLSDGKGGIGLYGFHDGAQSFRFGVDGTAFIGKSGRGRIHFDGNNGTIQSASWENNVPLGMQIDLDDGKIEIRGTKISYKFVPMTTQKEFYSNYTKYKGLYKRENNKYIAVTEYESGTNYYYKSYSINTFKDDTETKETQSQILLQSEDPYFYVRSKRGKNLIKISDEEDGYYLQSDNYQDGVSGMKINLDPGWIKAYGFTLDALAKTGQGRIQISSDGNPYFKVTNSDGDILVEMTNFAYYLQSAGYDSTSGFKIDIKEGKITANSDFKLEATATIDQKTQKFSINVTDSSSNATPLKIGTKFSVKWDGTVTATDGNFTGSINVSNGGAIGNWQIKDGNLQSSNGLVTLDGDTGAIFGSSISGGTITGGTITGSSISNGAGDKNFNVTSEGYLNAKGAVLDYLTVNNELIVKGNYTSEAFGDVLTINNNGSVILHKQQHATISGEQGNGLIKFWTDEESEFGSWKSCPAVVTYGDVGIFRHSQIFLGEPGSNFDHIDDHYINCFNELRCSKGLTFNYANVKVTGNGTASLAGADGVCDLLEFVKGVISGSIS